MQTFRTRSCAKSKRIASVVGSALSKIALITDAFLGRRRAQIPITLLAVVIRSERVAKEVEVLLAGILQLGFHLVEREPEPGHHRFGPRQRLGRMSAAEDDEVVGIGDDMGAERLAACGLAPMLEEAVHVQVGQHRACGSLNAKDNFQFERTIIGFRGRNVVDLRRKQ
jgi:hypothetical protein